MLRMISTFYCDFNNTVHQEWHYSDNGNDRDTRHCTYDRFSSNLWAFPHTGNDQFWHLWTGCDCFNIDRMRFDKHMSTGSKQFPTSCRAETQHDTNYCIRRWFLCVYCGLSKRMFVWWKVSKTQETHLKHYARPEIMFAMRLKSRIFEISIYVLIAVTPP